MIEKREIRNFRIGPADKENVRFLQAQGFNVSALIRRWLQTKADKIRREKANEN